MNRKNGKINFDEDGPTFFPFKKAATDNGFCLPP